MLRGILAGAFWGIVVGAMVLVAAAFAIDGHAAREAAPLVDPVADEAGRASPVDAAALAAAPALRSVAAGDSAQHPLTARRAKPALPDLQWPLPPVIALAPPWPLSEREQAEEGPATLAQPAPSDTGDAAREVAGPTEPRGTAARDTARAPDPSPPPSPPANDTASLAQPDAEAVPEIAAPAPPLVRTDAPQATDKAEADAPPAPDLDTLAPAQLLAGIEQPGPHVALVGPGQATGTDIPVYATLDAAGPDLSARLSAIAERARRDGAVAIRLGDDPALGAALADWMAREGLKPAPPEALPILWERAAQGT